MKVKPSLSPSETTVQVLRSFYRPHARVLYNPFLKNPLTGELTVPERRVKQSFVAECDIHGILKHYSATGQIRHMSANAQRGAYMDLPDDIDFQHALGIVKEGEAAFATLPSKVRERFGNDPARFLEFMGDPENRDEAVKLGLATKRPAPAQNEPQAPNPPPEAPTVPDGSKTAPEAKS